MHKKCTLYHMIDAFRFQHSLTGSEVLMLCKCAHYELWDHFQCQTGTGIHGTGLDMHHSLSTTKAVNGASELNLFFLVTIK